MRRGVAKREKKTKRNMPVFVIAILFGFLGVLAILYVPLNATPAYDDLLDKDTIVNRFYVVRHRKIADDVILESVNGDRFYVRGKYNREVLDEKLKIGVKVQVKYYERKAFYLENILCAEELVVNGEKICTYKNYDHGNMVGCSIVGVGMVGLSVFLFWGWGKKKISIGK